MVASTLGAAIVVDASVVVKWLTPEPHSDHARALYSNCIRRGARLAGPPHLLGEAMNALYQRLRTADPAKHLPRTAVDQAIARLGQVRFALQQPSGLYEVAFDFAVSHRLPSIYDAIYVSLAQMIGADLWTADQRLLTAIGGAAPWVRFIGVLPAAVTAQEHNERGFLL